MTASLSSPGRSRPGLSWVSTSPVWSPGASGSAELVSTQSFHSVCSLRHILAFVAMRVGVLPCSLTRCGTSWLGPSGLAFFCLNIAGLASMVGPQLVSSAESQHYE